MKSVSAECYRNILCYVLIAESLKSKEERLISVLFLTTSNERTDKQSRFPSGYLWRGKTKWTGK